ncbi:MAG TPA: hypothetical protein PLQ11_05210 [Beijerinckiaceae bacterium]|nr:hypothetical protein [Beijerinckiaceae bacterium]
MKFRTLMLIAAAGMTVLASLPAAAQYSPAAACRSRCEGILDRSNNVNSGALTRRYNACMAQCNQRQNAENAYRRCMANARGNQAAIQNCRNNYQRDR